MWFWGLGSYGAQRWRLLSIWPGPCATSRRGGGITRRDHISYFSIAVVRHHDQGVWKELVWACCSRGLVYLMVKQRQQAAGMGAEEASRNTRLEQQAQSK